MIGHCGVVSRQRRSVSFCESFTTSATPMSHCNAPSITNTLLQTIQPGLDTPLSVPPPNRKYISGCRSLDAPFQPPMKCAGGAAPEIKKTHTYSLRPLTLHESPQRKSCSVFSGGQPSSVHSRFVASASSPAHSSTSLKCGTARPANNSRPLALRTGGRSTLFNIPSAKSLAGVKSFSPCWYWMPIVAQPNSSAILTAAMYILHCCNTCASVRSLASSGPRRNFTPFFFSQA